MKLIWQEFKAIAGDVWDKIALWAGGLLKGIAANYQPLIVLAVGLPISFFLLGIPIAAALDSIVAPLRWMFASDEGAPAYRGGNGFVFLLMFVLGCMVITLTVELADRIFKRLEGKPKAADQPTSTESGAS